MAQSFGLTDTGCTRTENQDRILLEPARGLFAVCDGMGGHACGALAAETAVEAIRQYIERSSGKLDITWPFGFDLKLSIDANRLITGVKLANSQIWKKAEQSPEYAGMGSTVAAVLLGEKLATVANVGDSRVYHMRSGVLKQISTDDTIVASLVSQGTIPAAAARTHPMRHVLLQAAGSSATVNVHLCEQALEAGDILLVASDGVHAVVEDDAVREALLGGASLEKTVETLIGMARDAGGPDNISVILIRE